MDVTGTSNLANQKLVFNFCDEYGGITVSTCEWGQFCNKFLKNELISSSEKCHPTINPPKV